MAFADNYDFSLLVNEAERMVLDELSLQMESGEHGALCTCQDCVLDMAALALNGLKPVYRVSLLGTMYAHAMTEGQYMEEVRKAVFQAIEKIKANPSHE